MAINPPQNLMCAFTGGYLTVMWSSPVSGGDAYTQFRLHRYDCARGEGCGIASEVCLPSTARSYTWSGLPNGIYTVHIRAMSSCPSGSQSSSTISQCVGGDVVCNVPTCNFVVS